jgi:uncharacterized protein
VTAIQIIGIVVLCLAMVLALGSIILGLPGIWMILILAVAAGAIEGFAKINLAVILILIGLALFGELLEFLIGYFGARLKGASRAASVAALIGAIAGAFLLGSWLPVVGALVGAFGGAFLGAFIVELFKQGKAEPAYRAGVAAMFGRVGSIAAKLAMGVAMIVIVIYRLI